MLIAVLFAAALVQAAVGYATFQSEIPNGAAVPSPCSKTDWNGVGHYLSRGTGPLNPFGVDFAAANYHWNHALCAKDSDRDGRTNGEELGDPHCHFTTTNHAHLVAATGHPGLCEPVGSSLCAWQNFTC